MEEEHGWSDDASDPDDDLVEDDEVIDLDEAFGAGHWLPDDDNEPHSVVLSEAHEGYGWMSPRRLT